MSDYRRLYVPGGTYFFTIVTHRRRAFLTTEIARQSLRIAIREVKLEHPFQLNAIVLLPDHFHCICTLPPGDVNYPLRLKLIKSCFTQNYLTAGGSELPQSRSRVQRGMRGVWQKRYFEHTCRDEEDLKRCTDYLHFNPLKHGLVTRVVDWPWSSFHRYVQLGEYTTDWGGAPEFYGDEWDKFE